MHDVDAADVEDLTLQPVGYSMSSQTQLPPLADDVAWDNGEME